MLWRSEFKPSPEAQAAWRAAFFRQQVGSHPLRVLAVGAVAVVVTLAGHELLGCLIILGLGIYRLRDIVHNFGPSWRAAMRVQSERRAWQQADKEGMGG
jgi:hypothetical protein